MEGTGASYLPGLPRETAIIARGLIKSLNKVIKYCLSKPQLR